MKRRLFWKILLGFWLTTILIIQGVWLMFDVASDAAAERVNTGRSFRPDRRRGGDRGHPPAAIRLADPMAYMAGRLARPCFGTSVTAPCGHPARRTSAPPPMAPRHTLPRPFHAAAGPRRRAARGLLALDIPWQVLDRFRVRRAGFQRHIGLVSDQPDPAHAGWLRRLAQGNFATRLGPAMGRRRDEIADLAHDFDTMAKGWKNWSRPATGYWPTSAMNCARRWRGCNWRSGWPARTRPGWKPRCERIGREAAKLDEMVGELLTLVQAGKRRGNREQYFDIAEIVKAVVEDAQYQASGKAWRSGLDPARGQTRNGSHGQRQTHQRGPSRISCATRCAIPPKAARSPPPCARRVHYTVSRSPTRGREFPKRPWRPCSCHSGSRRMALDLAWALRSPSAPWRCMAVRFPPGISSPRVWRWRSRCRFYHSKSPVRHFLPLELRIHLKV